MTEEKQNTFAQMEQENKNNINSKQPDQVQEPIVQKNEINVNDFSDTAIGDKKKYVRPELHGKEDVVDKFVVMPIDESNKLYDTLSKTSQYYTPTMILYWTSKNSDGVQNKEYISGAKVWKNKDGSKSDINFFYEGGARKNNQSCILWEKVAECLKLDPKELSPRQFYTFLNIKPKFVIEKLQTDNFNAPPGSPKYIYKNMPGKQL